MKYGQIKVKYFYKFTEITVYYKWVCLATGKLIAGAAGGQDMAKGKLSTSDRVVVDYKGGYNSVEIFS